jgi:hypothetical protein
VEWGLAAQSAQSALTVQSALTARSARLPQEALAESRELKSRQPIDSLILRLAHAGPTPYPPHAGSHAWQEGA